jgi:hypothetical protein
MRWLIWKDDSGPLGAGSSTKVRKARQMRLSTLWITATSVLLGCALHAQDLTSTW